MFRCAPCHDDRKRQADCADVTGMLYYRMQTSEILTCKVPSAIARHILEYIIVTLQRWWRRVQNTRLRCEDCGTSRFPRHLTIAPACGDFWIGYELCCHKLVCLEGCTYYCNAHHRNMVYDPDYYQSKRYQECRECSGGFHVNCVWYGGTSPCTARERYQ